MAGSLAIEIDAKRLPYVGAVFVLELTVARLEGFEPETPGSEDLSIRFRPVPFGTDSNLNPAFSFSSSLELVHLRCCQNCCQFRVARDSR